MSQLMQQDVDYFDQPEGVHTRGEKADGKSSDEVKFGSAPLGHAMNEDGLAGEVYDPYGGKKLGMIRVGEN